MTASPEPITIRRYINDAGISTVWLVGHWPPHTRISPYCLERPDLFGEIVRDDDTITLDVLNARARYRIVGYSEFTNDLIADLVEADYR